MSVNAPATRPPVQDSAVAMVSLRIRHRSSSERARARASLPLMLSSPPGQADGGARGRGDAFLAAGEAEPLAGGRLDGDAGYVEPAISAIRARMVVAHAVPMFGRSQIMVTSRLAMRPPRAVTRSTAYFRKRSDDAPFHCGSLGGKCEPISPSASAPRMASTSACRPTSPSEWARKPRYAARARRRSSDDRRRRRRARRSRCRSVISPSPAARRASSRTKSSGSGEFHVRRIALECRHRQSRPFGQRGVVGEIAAALARSAAMSVENHVETERLRRLCDPQAARAPASLRRFPLSSTA